jgi:hypothetical protein
MEQASEERHRRRGTGPPPQRPSVLEEQRSSATVDARTSMERCRKASWEGRPTLQHASHARWLAAVLEDEAEHEDRCRGCCSLGTRRRAAGRGRQGAMEAVGDPPRRQRSRQSLSSLPCSRSPLPPRLPSRLWARERRGRRGQPSAGARRAGSMDRGRNQWRN